MKLIDLPNGTLIKTKNGYLWEKISNSEAVLRERHSHRAWGIGDIYRFGASERLKPTDKIILMFKQYYKKCLE